MAQFRLFLISLLFSGQIVLSAQSKAEKKLEKLFDQITAAYVKKDHDLALTKIREAEELAKEQFPENRRVELSLLSQKLLVVERMGRLKDLLILYEREEQIILKVAGKDNNLYLGNQLNQARVLQQLANYQRSERLFRDLEPKFRERHPGSLTLANFLRDYGNLLFYLGQFREAKSIFEENLQYYRNHLGDVSIQTSIGLNNLAMILMEERNLKEAHGYLKESYLSRMEMGYEDESYATICYNFGLVFLELDKLDSAEWLLKQAVKMRSKINGEDHALYGASIGGIGRVYHRKGDVKKAADAYNQALTIVGKGLGTKHPRYTQLLSRMATLLDESEDEQGAFEYHQKTMENVYWLIRNVFPGLSESEQANYYYSIKYLIQRFYTHALSFRSPEALGEMYNAQLQFKGLFGRTASNLARQIKDKGGAEAEAIYLTLIELRKSHNEAIRKNREDEVKVLLKLIEEKEKELSSIFPSVNEIVNPRNNWTAIRDILEQGEVAIEIIRNEDGQYHALGLTTESPAPFLLEIGPSEILEGPALQTYRNSVKFKLEDKKSYATYWNPLQGSEHLMNANKIYLSADGVYHFINLLGLPSPDGGYLLDQVEINQMSSTAELLQDDQAINKKSVSIFGSPSFDLNIPVGEKTDGHWSRTLEGTQLSPLPGTKKEAEQIHRSLTAGGFQTNLFLDHDVKEETVKEISSPGVLHIATHGFFLVNQKSAITERNFLGLESLSDFEHPMRKSGLMLAGSQQAIRGEAIGSEDGILTSLEAALIDLSETELSVLSACETGLGEVQNGEGVFGLQRALKVAGSKNLVMSLWKVDDEATQMLMTQFYSSLTKGQSIGSSLKSGQELVRTKYPHPYFWAAFVHLGKSH